jgi:hypothetical protein
MVTVNRVGGQIVDKGAEFFGLSSDTKPTEDVPNASTFICLDTLDTYFFDEENQTWIQV